ncbi:MAG: outer membrane lipoprotein chaperone LolA [Azoarcus sp.]|jgi:outer membrane lipoprotein carrier protein|nr:outer membrane lipoprotein chaperone LolA [Azoarcus sp.]
MKRLRGGLAALLFFVACNAAAAGAADYLRQFVAATRGAEGEFQQTVSGNNGQPPQKSSGKFSFSRPGKFRWEYDLPYPQLLVGDGKQLWSWDRDLRQVTVRPIGNALGSTPAAILFGQNEIERDFILSESTGGEGTEGAEKLSWVDARPRQPTGNAGNAAAPEGDAINNGFQVIRFGFDGKRLQRLALRDNFGQITVIDFSNMRLNPSFAPEHFRFVPPPGVDILGDPAATQ